MDAFIRVKDGNEILDVPLECFINAILSRLPEQVLSQVLAEAVELGRKMKKPIMQLELSRIAPPGSQIPNGGFPFKN